MRVKLSRLSCAAVLIALPHLLVQGCSSAQQEDEFAAQEGYSQEGYEDEGYADQAGYSQEGYEEEGYGQEGASEETAEEGYGNYGGENYAETNSTEDYANYEGYGEAGGEIANAELGNQILDGEQTKSDLEDIIAGQNADAEEIPAEVANIVDADAGYNVAPDAGYDAVPAAANVAADPAAMPMANAVAPVATPGMSAGPALPEMGAKMPYVVRVGESLSSIATKVYGSSDKWQEMVELTSLSNPDFVKPGDVVYYQLTEQTLAFASAYEGAPREVVTIQPGDTLAGIAQRVYGAAGDWKFIWRQNAELANPDKLEVGQSVYLVSPAALGAAIDQLKSMTIADLIDQTFEKQDPNANNQNIDHLEASVQVDNTQTQVNGFQIAKSMFNVFASNIGIAG